MFGFVGLGAMGAPMARRLIGAGHAVMVHDLDPSRLAALKHDGALAAGSLRDLADQAETAFLSLPVPAAVQEVVAGLLGGTALRTIVDLSTTGPSVTAQLAAAAEAKGVALVDAPVSGGVSGAQAGTLAIMVSGAPAAVEGVMPALGSLGTRIFPMGDRPGLGQSMKLINNLLCAVSAVAVFEATVMGVKAGLDPARMVEVLNVSSGRSFVTQEKLPKSVLPRSFPMTFATALLAKDVRLALAMAGDLGAGQSVGEAAGAALQAALDRGEAGQDYTTLIRHFEALAGVVVGVKEGIGT